MKDIFQRGRKCATVFFFYFLFYFGGWRVKRFSLVHLGCQRRSRCHLSRSGSPSTPAHCLSTITSSSSASSALSNDFFVVFLPVVLKTATRGRYVVLWIATRGRWLTLFTGLFVFYCCVALNWCKLLSFLFVFFFFGFCLNYFFFLIFDYWSN